MAAPSGPPPDEPTSLADDIAAEVSQPASVVLHEEQEAILKKVINGESCFLTGAAGSGKSVLLRAIIGALRERGRKVGITATTGLAAQHLDPIDGKTVHSWSGILPGMDDVEKIVDSPQFQEQPRTNWLQTDTLIVDEVSMMSDSFINLLGDVGKYVRGRPSDPFGGLQVIFAGDFFQLPPVVKDGSDQTGDKSFAFNSRTWKDALPAEKCHFLHHAHRQKDPRFAAMLDRIRFGRLSVGDLKMLNQKNELVPRPKKGDPVKVVADPTSTPTFLSAVNRDVDAHNLACITALRERNGESHAFTAVDNSNGAAEKVARSTKLRPDFITDVVKQMQADCPMSGQVELMVGARVMIVQNHKIGRDHVVEFGHAEQQPSIELEVGGKEVHLVDAVLDGALEPLAEVVQKKTRKSKKSKKPTKKEEEASRQSGLDRYPLYNGMQGVIERFEPYTRFRPPPDGGEPLTAWHDQINKQFARIPVVRFSTGALVMLPPLEHRTKEQVSKWGPPLATRTQIPLKLAFAMSIHKCQGTTLDAVRVDLAAVWECGQLYVALSRCTTFDALQIVNFLPSQILADDSVKRFYRSFTSYNQASAAQKATLNTVDAPAAAAEVVNPAPAVATLVEEPAAPAAPVFKELIHLLTPPPPTSTPAATTTTTTTPSIVVQAASPAQAYTPAPVARSPASDVTRATPQSSRAYGRLSRSQNLAQQQQTQYHQQFNPQMYAYPLPYPLPYYADLCHHVRSLSIEEFGGGWSSTGGGGSSGGGGGGGGGQEDHGRREYA